jgi:ATP-binding cassette subfamily B protein
LCDRLRGKRLHMAREQVIAQLAASVIALLAAGAAVGWMGWKLVLGLVTLGDLALFYQAFSRGQGLMRSLLENAGQVYANSLFLGDLFEFLSLNPQVTDPEKPMPVPLLRQGIRLEKVTFTYPGRERPVLENMSLEIPAGQVAAIVGPNGVGKSTLIKLLCRLYDPDQGQIFVDEVDLRRFKLEDLRRRITVLFQEPVHYQESASENIRLSSLNTEKEEPLIRQAASAAGADEFISRLPEGYGNLLGRWFAGGVDLSVGEWQRVALARAFLRKAPLIILDEPTSALDPWTEADWMQRFRQLAAGQTALVITHRLTTAARADVIYVMQAGKIIESGTHRELVAAGGLYARSWKSQVGDLLEEEISAVE